MLPSTNPTPTPAQNLHELDATAPLRWLTKGWTDFRRNPNPGLVHGILLTVLGVLSLFIAHDKFWILAGAMTGFLIISPVLATGLYQVSRHCAMGQCVGMTEVFDLWFSGDQRLVRFGMLLALAGVGWVMVSSALITYYSPVPIQKPADFFRYVVFAPQIGLFEAWLLLSIVLAAPIFASSVLALPMLVDTSVTVNQAVATSWRAVATYPMLMGSWALILAILMGLAMSMAMLGLVIVIPWLGHASWHAYQEIIVHLEQPDANE